MRSRLRAHPGLAAGDHVERREQPGRGSWCSERWPLL